MRFVIIYENTRAIRAQIIRLIIHLVRKHKVDLSTLSLRSPNFMSIPHLPSREHLDMLPLRYQCEELELIDNEIKSHFRLVIDV
jgi:hypothetical protein